MANKSRGRRLRRQRKAKLRHGRKAGPRHAAKTGRTGGIHYKKTPSSKKSGYVSININLTFSPPSWWSVTRAKDVWSNL